ncbi:glucose-1-phosphate cytidylyltransferase [Anaerorhabdus furcosa]|uniref:Glucose-1-phosphate cytidylyltransferase n=1 Tax=Anaerorhabdus furcosa TaxID=118967 RepID=A0A1T4LT15_9FIRM|nr:glucose-1-phosphate cytidylyltransferase [Anaerorhabdus furcosa]SJZ57870.1 glucose-1-phosphate cytidylyltransferase [Anaerorhabdus furcosa]
MKVVILAGGYGTRISEESHLKPKPMIEIGGKPILWHIMKYYSFFGHNEFVICAGYKQEVIKEWFSNYFLHTSDITFDFTQGNKLIVHNNVSENWKVTIVDTGLSTMTGGRIKRIKNYIDNEPFFLTYGDGVANVDLDSLIDEHKKSNKLLTLTTIQPGGRFGSLEIDENNVVKSFQEKNPEDGGWINGGFMVINPKVFEYIEGDTTVFEKEPLEKLAQEENIYAYKHQGFWQCMDTVRDKEYLEQLIKDNEAPWEVWKK